MLDAALAGVGGFGCGDAVGNVADKGDAVALGGLSDGEIGVAAEDGLNFDEVDAARDELMNSLVGFFTIGDDERRLERWRRAVKIRSWSDEARAEALPFCDLFSKRNQRFEIAAHVANAGDTVGEQERNDEFAAAVGFACGGKVDVHVDEAGYEEFSVGVEDLRAALDGDGVRRAEIGDALLFDDDRLIGQWRGAGHIDHRDMSDGKSGFEWGRAGAE